MKNNPRDFGTEKIADEDHGNTPNQNDSMRIIAENLPCGIIKRKADSSNKIVYISNGFTHMLNCSVESLRSLGGMNFYSWVNKYDAASLKASFENMDFGIDAWITSEYRLNKCNGSVIWVHDKSKLIVENGEKFIYSILIDITDRKKAELALELSQKQIEIALNHTSYLLFTYNMKKHITIVQSGAQKYSIVPKINKKAPECFIENGFIAPEDAEMFLAIHKNICDGCNASSAEIRVLTSSGKYEWVRIALTAYYDDFARLRGRLASLRT